MHILILQSGSSERVLLMTPLLRALHTEKNAQTTVVVSDDNKKLLAENPHLANLASFSEFRAGRKASRPTFDCVIDLSNTLTTRLIRALLPGKKITFRRANRLQHWIYMKLRLGSINHQHISEQYLSLVKHLGIAGDNEGVDFYVPDKDEVENNWLPASHQGGYAVVAISAAQETKKLPLNRLIELCDRINKPVILLGEEQDQQTCQEIASFFERGTVDEEKEIENLNKKTIIFNACGKFNFNQRASLIKHANWVFTFDSIYMHLAAAFKKMLFTTWGSSSPLFGEYPFQTQFTVFENNKLSCRPCARSGFNHCPKGHFKCMQDVTFDFYLPD